MDTNALSALNAYKNQLKMMDGADVPAQVLQPLKIFVNGQKPGPGEVG